MNYQNVKSRIVRKFTRANGYSGKTVEIGLAFVNGQAMEVGKCGYWVANNYKYVREEEMLYYYDNHRRVHFPQAIENVEV